MVTMGMPGVTNTSQRKGAVGVATSSVIDFQSLRGAHSPESAGTEGHCSC